LPVFDPSVVTHIITDAQRRPTLRALGLRALDEIPDHVPTVTWGWVISGLGRAEKIVGVEEEIEMDDVCMHAAFIERFDAGAERFGQSKGKGKGKAKAGQDKRVEVLAGDAGEISRISCAHCFSCFFVGVDNGCSVSEFTQVQQGGPSPIGVSTTSATPVTTPRIGIGASEDPLTEFYALARAEIENAVSLAGSGGICFLNKLWSSGQIMMGNFLTRK